METNKSNTVLVTYDFTPVGEMTINNAAEIAKLLKYKLCILHVINSHTKHIMRKMGKKEASINEKLQELAEKMINIHGIDVSFIAERGSIFNSIGQYASEIKANLVIIGTHGRRGLQHLLGSFAVKVVKSSPVPIILYQKEVPNCKYKDIIFPLDLSVGSRQKGSWAVEIAKKFGSTIHIYAHTYHNQESFTKAEKVLEQMEDFFDDNGVAFTMTQAPKRSYKNFGQQIIDFANEKKADLILISTNPEEFRFNIVRMHDENIIYNKFKIPVMCVNVRDLNLYAYKFQINP